MQSITGFFKKVIAPSDNDDTASHPENGEEIQTQTAESYKGDNSWDQDESDGGLSDDLRILKETVYGKSAPFRIWFRVTWPLSFYQSIF